MNLIFIILMILLLAIAIFTFIFTTIYYREKSRKQNLFTIPQNSSLNEQTILENKIINLQEQLTKRQDELIATITNFKDQAYHQDKEFVAKITALETNLRNIDGIIKKNDSDFNQKFEQKNQNLHDHFKELMKDLTLLKEQSNKLTTLDENVRSLQQVFTSSKKQGNLGEYMLETIVNNIYGTQHIWQRQHRLPDGSGIVDMYLDLAPDRDGIAIDSKFPLEKYLKNFQNINPANKKQFLQELKIDIKSKVRDVSKYINSKNNLSSVIMFIPSETVFSYIFEEIAQEVIDYAINKKVWIASPMTLAAILFMIDKHTKEIRTNKNIEKIKKQMLLLFDEFTRLHERWDKLHQLIDKTGQQADDLNLTHRKIFDKYTRIYEAQALEDHLESQKKQLKNEKAETASINLEPQNQELTNEQ